MNLENNREELEQSYLITNNMSYLAPLEFSYTKSLGEVHSEPNLKIKFEELVMFSQNIKFLDKYIQKLNILESRTDFEPDNILLFHIPKNL